MHAVFYDIESLENVFTLCHFNPKRNALYVYYLCDDDDINPNESDMDELHELVSMIVEKNKNIHASCVDGACDIILRDLRHPWSNEELAQTFGLCDASPINNPNSYSSYGDKYRIVCDTDTEEYDEEKHPFYAGYNSYNYDTTMLTLFLYETFNKTDTGNGIQIMIKPPSAAQMRKYNDVLFSDKFKSNMPSFLTYRYEPRTNSYVMDSYSSDKALIRKNMLMSGRHIDIARLNEKQQHVGLKRLLGMMGYQILESDKLHGNVTRISNKEELFELLAYNASDTINLYWLSLEKVYAGQFSLKRGLLRTYPDLIYDKQSGAYAPNIQKWAVRNDRLTIDSSSAQFATKTLCPYGHLSDIETVSYMYPSENKAKELGIPRVDVLEETKKFFYANFPQPEVRREFDKVYDYYASIRGKNFNDSKNYAADFRDSPNRVMPISIDDIPKCDLSMPYFDKDGKPTTGFVNFSVGGIHGAEYNKALYEKDLAEYNADIARMREVQSMYPVPTDLKKAKKVTLLSDGKEYKAAQFLKSGATCSHAEWKTIKKPVLFVTEEKGNTKVSDKYAYTSADLTNHEDFTSYYPNLLRMMEAFYNAGLGEDRYAKVFFQKQEYGRLMKDKTKSDDEIELLSVLREGTKLILNSASGAGDTAFESNIRMNNRIISMRVIGQLFSFRIGAAQTIAGAKVTSTNTDGLYSVLDPELNEKILKRESESIHVDIEPEPVFLISKDTNNRIEYNLDKGFIIDAKGGSVGCRKGPTPTKALSHPAIIDWVMTEYLLTVSLDRNGRTLFDDFDDKLGMEILKRSLTEFDDTKWLIMFQNVIASSIGSVTYIYGLTPNDTHIRPHILQHYNRVFIMKDNTPDTLFLRAAVARKITPAMREKRRKENLPAQNFEPLAHSVLMANGVTRPPAGTDVTSKKITNIQEDWYMNICNKDLHTLSRDEIDFIKDNIDYDKYLFLIHGTFTKSWKNTRAEVV